MNFRILAIILCLLSCKLMTAQNIEHFKHIVQSGETLPAIADKYGMTTNQISVFNPNLSENVVSGQSINIPLSSKGCINYKISSGETLYSISKRFQVSLNAIYEVNNISPETVVNVGRIIEIPVRQKDNNAVKKGCKLMYKVEKKETIYGICRKFNITEDEFIAANPQLRNEKLKKNKYVCIPYSNSEIEEAMTPVAEVVEEVEDAFEVGIILPFGLSKKTLDSNNHKMLDFYRGFLLALEETKGKLESVNVHAIDESIIDSLGTNVIVNSDNYKNLDLIIGPYNPNYIKPIVQFATSNNMDVVIPFSSKEDYFSTYNNVFQLNVVQSDFYNKTFKHLIDTNKNTNFIFFNSDDKSENTNFSSNMKKYMTSIGISFKEISSTAISEITSLLSKDENNMLICSFGTEKAFEKLIRNLDNAEGISGYQLSIFGQPNWIQFAENKKYDFSKYNCRYFTKFISENSISSIKEMENKFEVHFKTSQYPSFPKYGIMGYDIGKYFLNNEAHFVNDAQLINVPTLQTPLNFEKGDKGYFNNQIIFVSYDSNGHLQKHIF